MVIITQLGVFGARKPINDDGWWMDVCRLL